jgi:hypothetical protein
MKTYYVYRNRLVITTINAASISDAISALEGMTYDSISTVYIPEPRTAGEILDDTLDLTKRAAKAAVPTVRTKLSNLFGNMSRALSTAPVAK